MLKNWNNNVFHCLKRNVENYAPEFRVQVCMCTQFLIKFLAIWNTRVHMYIRTHTRTYIYVQTFTRWKQLGFGGYISKVLRFPLNNLPAKCVWERIRVSKLWSLRAELGQLRLINFTRDHVYYMHIHASTYVSIYIYTKRTWLVCSVPKRNGQVINYYCTSGLAHQKGRV